MIASHYALILFGLVIGYLAYRGSGKLINAILAGSILPVIGLVL